MSTSIAAQPAYVVTSAARPSQAKPDRTIFGTTLDRYGKCWELLNNPQALKAAEDLHEAKIFVKLGQRGSPAYQREVKRAWLKRNNKYPQVEAGHPAQTEEELEQDQEEEEERRAPTLREVASRTNLRGPGCFVRNRAGRTKAKSAFANRNLGRPGTLRTLSAQTVGSQGLRAQSEQGRKAMSAVTAKDRRPSGGGSKVSVPKFRVPPNAARLMRTASLKITETGAKDLLHSREVNKIGLGDTLQYNHEAFKQREFPQFYRSHGDVRLLGQHFRGDTTNSDITAPGGFYRLDTPDREINERFRERMEREGQDGVPRGPCYRSTYEQQWKETRDSGVSAESELTEERIPLNIRHKFGTENIQQLLKENKREVKAALKGSGDLKHSGIVPPRKDVKELNHPIDPPPAYFDTFGKHLKYDKLEGGLHLYIK